MKQVSTWSAADNLHKVRPCNTTMWMETSFQHSSNMDRLALSPSRYLIYSSNPQWLSGKFMKSHCHTLWVLRCSLLEYYVRYIRGGLTRLESTMGVSTLCISQGGDWHNIHVTSVSSSELFRWPTSGGCTSRTRSVSLSVSGHLTWTHDISVPSLWNWIKLYGDIPWVFVY